MTATRTPLAPATGTVRWMGGDPATGLRWLRIATQTARGEVADVYQVETIPTGYRLYRIDRETFALVVYTIDTTRHPGVWFCDCPDASNRPERCGCCKHARGLRAGLDRLPF